LRLSGIKDHTASHLAMLKEVLERHDDFDIIHFHIDLLPLAMFDGLEHKCLMTMHGRLDLIDYMPVYKAFPRMPLVSISESQRLPMPPAMDWLRTVYHGLPSDVCPFNEQGGDYLAFLGRISREKRPDRAIEIATRAGAPIKIAAKVDPADQCYFDAEIKHLLDNPLVEFIGEINEATKSEFLGNAAALLFPIDWPEPFGLVMIEAMSAGTPVIAWRNGSVPEVIEDGVSGRIVATMDEAVAAVMDVKNLSRRGVREGFASRFTAKRMAQTYVAAYRELLDRGSVGSQMAIAAE
jgi:glycosyltransferase involved in cell wall biosynthesis